MPENPYSILPDISFAPSNVQALLDEMVRDYEAAYLQFTGKNVTLAPASEPRIQLYTQALRFFHAYQLIDQGCKMNLPKYSYGSYLENLASILLGPNPRQPAKPSYCSLEFTLSAPRSVAVTIPTNTRASTQDNIYFATQNPLVIPAGQLSIQGDAVSVQAGANTAGLLAGQINNLVDPVPYVATVVNITASQGGSDIESDDSLKLRMAEFPNSRSTAGPESAYRYFVRTFSAAIEAVSVQMPQPGYVDIYFTLEGGQLPDAPLISGLMDYLTDKRPLTDNLSISAPHVQSYQIEATYYIAESNRARAEEIQVAVEAAADQYKAWQSAQVGRDLLPDKLISLMVEAGAKRVPVTQPVYTQISQDTICLCSAVELTFGGIESD